MSRPVVCTPLLVEKAALHGRLTNPPTRTGKGPLRSRARTARLVRGDPAVLVAGLAGALVGDVKPGDLVVATEVVDASDRRQQSRSAPLLAAALRRSGLVVHLGPIASSPRIVHGAARSALADTGALAVDMESAELAGSASHGAFAVVRAVVDTPDAPLLRLGTGKRGLAALRSLRAAAPAIEQWTAATGAREVVLAAHGVAPQVRTDAAARDLRIVDATCPLVTKVHSEVRRYAARGDTVFLIGHGDHEEVVGTLGEAPQSVLLVETSADAHRVQPRDPDRVAYVMQTTLAVDEAAETAQVLRERFPLLAAPRRADICYATTNRQQAVRSVAASTDLVLVVGSANSSNSRRLVEVAEREGTPAQLVDDVSDVDLRWLAGKPRVGISAGASAPERVLEEIVTALSGLGPVTVREDAVVDEDVEFVLPKEVS